MSDSEIERSCDNCQWSLNYTCINAKSMFAGEDTDKVKVCGKWVWDDIEGYRRSIQAFNSRKDK